jgi:acyl-coenzyme A thioesterase PaaI-like protein
MKTFLANITLKAAAYLMISIMGLYMTNMVMFTHIHKVADGTVIVHAHPYHKSNDTKPYKSHHHTKYELLLYKNLEILFFLFSLTCALFYFDKKSRLSIVRKTIYSQTCILLYKGRAPPVF